MLYIYLGAAIFYLLSAIGAGWYGLEQGKKLERADYLRQEIKRGEEINKGVKEIVRHVEQQNDAARAGLIVALGKREREYDKVINDYRDLTTTNQRLRVKADRAASCNKQVPGAGKDTGLPDREIEVELSEKVTRSIRAIGLDADIDAANCNALRDIISVNPVIEVIGYAEKEQLH
jgi:hypothetical protein